MQCYTASRAKTLCGCNVFRTLCAMFVCAVQFRSSLAPLLCYLHWLPVRHRITHKVAALTVKALLHHQPTYLYQMLAGLRSSSAGLLVKPDQIVLSPSQLPQKIRMASTTEQFSRILKTHLFNRDCVAHLRRLRLVNSTHELRRRYTSLVIDWVQHQLPICPVQGRQYSHRISRCNL